MVTRTSPRPSETYLCATPLPPKAAEYILCSPRGLQKYSAQPSAAFLIRDSDCSPPRRGLLDFMSAFPPPTLLLRLLFRFKLQALDRSVPRRTRTANPGSECSLPFPVGPPQASNQSVPRRTSAASSGSDLRTSTASPPVFPAGPQPRAPEQTVPRRTSTPNNIVRYTR